MPNIASRNNVVEVFRGVDRLGNPSVTHIEYNPLLNTPAKVFRGPPGQLKYIGLAKDVGYDEWQPRVPPVYNNVSPQERYAQFKKSFDEFLPPRPQQNNWQPQVDPLAQSQVFNYPQKVVNTGSQIFDAGNWQEEVDPLAQSQIFKYPTKVVNTESQIFEVGDQSSQYQPSSSYVKKVTTTKWKPVIPADTSPTPQIMASRYEPHYNTNQLALKALQNGDYSKLNHILNNPQSSMLGTANFGKINSSIADPNGSVVYAQEVTQKQADGDMFKTSRNVRQLADGSVIGTETRTLVDVNPVPRQSTYTNGTYQQGYAAVNAAPQTNWFERVWNSIFS
ncbi:MAG: hypothetical protein KF874_11965 [Rhizobiaceae bacterium]|nr:hypothetical protein [Rhizobiaceae bacterium]